MTAGDHSIRLQEGDFIIYHCDTDHEINNIGNQEAIIHLVVRFRKKIWE